jgi:hypothetical protein
MPNDRRSYLTYSPEIADEFCALIAEGKSMRQITEQPGMPSRRAVLYWLGRYPDFREKYEYAMMLLAEFWAHEIIEIADDSSGDYVITEDGRPVIDTACLPDTRGDRQADVCRARSRPLRSSGRDHDLAGLSPGVCASASWWRCGGTRST